MPQITAKIIESITQNIVLFTRIISVWLSLAELTYKLSYSKQKTIQLTLHYLIQIEVKPIILIKD